MLFRGSGTALVTPFRDGQIDWPALETLVRAQVCGGTKALIACGTTGEPSTLSAREKRQVVSFVINHAQGLPVIAGVGGNDTAEVVESCKAMENEGADGLLAVTPYYNKTTQAGLRAHFLTIAEAAERPIMVYNVPSRTGLNLLPETTAVIAEHERIVALKEANPSFAQVMEDFRLCSGKLEIYSGNDDLLYPFLAMGGAGVVSVAANLIPAEIQGIVDAYDAGDWADALRLAQRYAPLVDLLFAQVSPIPLKAALSLLGRMQEDVRLPLVPMTEAEKQPLRAELISLGLFAGREATS